MAQKHSHFLWDLWCIASLIGIWPRFIEPNSLQTTDLFLKFPHLPPELDGTKILQFSDLHINQETSSAFLDKLSKKVEKLQPDLIVFTGDFLCNSILEQKERLQQWLNRFHAPYGCYAIFGNHDYQQNVSINENGEYDVVKPNQSSLSRAFQRIKGKEIKVKGIITQKAREVDLHRQLIELLHNTPFIVLHNATKLISIKGTYLNICGLGEYLLGRSLPEIAFRDYDPHYPGIVLVHNPDAVPHLKNYPGEIYLCGHTHGSQVNLPWLWKKFTLLENPSYTRGLFQIATNKWMYVNRGVGSVFPFRWFALPEITLLTLQKGK